MLLDIKDIEQRLHGLNAEESKLLADIQVSLAGIERIHAQRRMEELTLVELQRKANDDKPQTKKDKRRKQEKQGKGRGQKRGVEDQAKQSGPRPAKRQKHAGPSNVHGGHGIPVPIPGLSNHGGSSIQRQNQPSPGGECKCSRVDIRCGGNRSTCQVCKALGCVDVSQSNPHTRMKTIQYHGNAPGVAAAAASPWQTDTAGIIDVDTLGSQTYLV